MFSVPAGHDRVKPVPLAQKKSPKWFEEGGWASRRGRDIAQDGGCTGKSKGCFPMGEHVSRWFGFMFSHQKWADVDGGCSGDFTRP